MSVTATIHQDDGEGRCTACGTAWPAECIVERHAVWAAAAPLSRDDEERGDAIYQSLDSPRAIAHALFAPATDKAEEADE